MSAGTDKDKWNRKRVDEEEVKRKMKRAKAALEDVDGRGWGCGTARVKDVKENLG